LLGSSLEHQQTFQDSTAAYHKTSQKMQPLATQNTGH